MLYPYMCYGMLNARPTYRDVHSLNTPSAPTIDFAHQKPKSDGLKVATGITLGGVALGTIVALLTHNSKVAGKIVAESGAAAQPAKKGWLTKIIDNRRTRKLAKKDAKKALAELKLQYKKKKLELKTNLKQQKEITKQLREARRTVEALSKEQTNQLEQAKTKVRELERSLINLKAENIKLNRDITNLKLGKSIETSASSTAHTDEIIERNNLDIGNDDAAHWLDAEERVSEALPTPKQSFWARCKAKIQGIFTTNSANVSAIQVNNAKKISLNSPTGMFVFKTPATSTIRKPIALLEYKNPVQVTGSQVATPPSVKVSNPLNNYYESMAWERYRNNPLGVNSLEEIAQRPHYTEGPKLLTFTAPQASKPTASVATVVPKIQTMASEIPEEAQKNINRLQQSIANYRTALSKTSPKSNAHKRLQQLINVQKFELHNLKVKYDLYKNNN